LTTSSGTAALQLALAALDIGAGDEVVVPDLTFGACGNVVVRAGATPVFCDVDRGRWLMEPASVAALLTPRTKAIMVVHLYGHACEMAPIQELARAHGVAVIEDCAEALGPKYQGERVGRFGDVACFSFFANKVITTGEGGMVTTRQAALHERMKLLRDHGMRPERRYWHEAAGFNFRLTNVQAAIGVAQLERIEGSLLHRRAVVRRYESGLHGLPGVALPQRVDWADDVDWLFSVVVDETRAGVDRDTLAARLARQGVDTRPFFSALHEQPAFRSGRTGDCSNASWLAQRGLSLPTSSYIPLEHVDRVCSAVRGAIGGGTGPARPLRG
jgi:perosamine synthetase